MRGLLAQLAPHLPAHPEQQHAAGKQQADHLQELGRDAGKDDAQRGRGHDADDDGAAALIGRQARSREPDDDGVVAGEHEVDQDDLEQRGQRVGRDEFNHVRSFFETDGSSQWGLRRSIQSKTFERNARNAGTSSASSARPSGSIQMPSTGRKDSTPPTMSSAPEGIRTQRLDGCSR